MQDQSPDSGARAALILAEDSNTERQQLFGISELAKEFRVSTRTIRFYEDKGLLMPERVNSARIFSRRDRARLALILRAKAIGASLNDIKHFLDLYGEAGEGRRDQMAYLIERLEHEMDELVKKRSLIDDTLKDLRSMLQNAQGALSALDKSG